MKNTGTPGDVVATIKIGREPGATYEVEYHGGELVKTVELGDSQPEFWVLANAVDYIVGDWEANAVYLFGHSEGETLCAWCSKAIPVTSPGRVIYCPYCGTENLHRDEATVPTETVIFHWTRNHGDCYDCGLPAAFFAGDLPYCAVCAANHAADGETITRIEGQTRPAFVLRWEAEGDDGFVTLPTAGSDIYDQYFGEVLGWTNARPPRVVKLTLIEYALDEGTYPTDGELEAALVQFGFDYLIDGASWHTLLVTTIESGPNS